MGTPASIVASKTISVRPGQCYSDLTLNTTLPGLQSPATVLRRRIQFNDSVEQRIALDLTREPETIRLSSAVYDEDDDDDDISSEDGTTTLTPSTSSLSITSREPTTRHPPFLTTRSKTIASLPSTTLKSHGPSASASHRPPLSRGKRFIVKPEPKVVPSPPPPTTVLTPSRYLFWDIDDDSVSTYESAKHGVKLVVPTLVTARDPYEAFKEQPTAYGACMHYDEDEHALLLELGCI